MVVMGDGHVYRFRGLSTKYTQCCPLHGPTILPKLMRHSLWGHSALSFSKLRNFSPGARTRVSIGLLSWPHLFSTFKPPIAVSRMPVMSWSLLSSQRGSRNLIFVPVITLLDTLRFSSSSTSLVKSLKPSSSTTVLFVSSFVTVFLLFLLPGLRQSRVVASPRSAGQT